MVVKLIEIFKNSNVVAGAGYTLREIYINPEHVVCLREDIFTNRLLEEGKLPQGLDDRQKFTKVQLNRGSVGLDVIVVGDPNAVENKLRISEKQILKG